MTIEQIALITSFLISIFSLLVTVIGWGVTAYFQKQLLDRQIQAESKRVSRQLYIPKRILQLEEIKNWLQEGVEFTINIIDKKEKPTLNEQAILNEQYQLWHSQYLKKVVPAFIGTASRHPNSGAKLLNSISAFLDSLAHQIENSEGDKPENIFFNTNQEVTKFVDIISKGFEAIKAVEDFIERVAIDGEEE